jgi:hypothetical protein
MNFNLTVLAVIMVASSVIGLIAYLFIAGFEFWYLKKLEKKRNCKLCQKGNCDEIR